MISAFEKETIILFNEEEQMASIYTHNVGWQNHMEKKLGLSPIAVNSQNGRTYEIDKRRIRKPQPKRQYSPETLAKMRSRLRKLHEEA